MDNLDKLYSHLIEAQDNIYHNRLSEAKMCLMAAEGILRRDKTNYFDVGRMYDNIQLIKNIVGMKMKLYRKLYRDEKEEISDWIEILIEECDIWIRRRAA